MARKANSNELNPTPDGFNETRLAEAGKATQELAQLQPAMDEVLALGVDIGRFEALDFVATVATHHLLAVYDNVKKSGAWRLLRNPVNGHGGHFESLEEFCEVKLGKSYRRMRAISANRNTIGQEAFEQAEKIGIRQSDYNAIKALPVHKQEVIKEALADGADLETVTRALRQLAAEDQREIEALTKDKEELEANSVANDRILEANQRTITKLQKEVETIKHRIAKESPDEIGAQLREEVGQFSFNAEAAIRGSLAAGFAALVEHAQVNDCTHEEYMAGCLCSIERAVGELRSRYNIKAEPDGDEIPYHIKHQAELEEQATANIAQIRANRKPGAAHV